MILFITPLKVIMKRLGLIKYSIVCFLKLSVEIFKKFTTELFYTFEELEKKIMPYCLMVMDFI